MLLFYPMDTKNTPMKQFDKQPSNPFIFLRPEPMQSDQSCQTPHEVNFWQLKKAPKGLLRKRKKTGKKTYKKCFYLYISLQGSDACLFWAIGLQFECASPQFGINDVALCASRWIELKWFVTHLLLWCDKPCATSPLKSPFCHSR